MCLPDANSRRRETRWPLVTVGGGGSVKQRLSEPPNAFDSVSSAGVVCKDYQASAAGVSLTGEAKHASRPHQKVVQNFHFSFRLKARHQIGHRTNTSAYLQPPLVCPALKMLIGIFFFSQKKGGVREGKKTHTQPPSSHLLQSQPVKTQYSKLDCIWIIF